MKEQQQPYVKEVPLAKDLKVSENQIFFDDYKLYINEEIQMEGDPTSFEETIRDVNASKWQEAKEIEMKSMNTNEV
jgi:hypothetical protein